MKVHTTLVVVIVINCISIKIHVIRGFFYLRRNKYLKKAK